MNAAGKRRLLVTRADGDAPAWSAHIRARGAEPIEFPCVRIEALEQEQIAQLWAACLARGPALCAFTSARSVELLRSVLSVRLISLLAAVGPATERACRQAFGRCDLVAPESTAASLAAEIGRALRAGGEQARCVALPCAENAREELAGDLNAAGIEVVRVPLYRTVPRAADGPPVELGALALDAALVASPSAVDGLLARARVPPDLPLVAIGPTTAERARAAGFRDVRVAARPDLDAMLEVCP